MPHKHSPKTKHTAAAARADGASMSRAAESAGVHRTTVWRWESGADGDYTAGLQRCKRALLVNAANLATAAGTEILRRLQADPESASLSELNRIWGTAADKLFAANEEQSEVDDQRDEFARMTPEERIDYLADKLPPEMVAQIVDVQRKRSA